MTVQWLFVQYVNFFSMLALIVIITAVVTINGSSTVAVVPAFIVMLFDLIIGAIIFIVMS